MATEQQIRECARRAADRIREAGWEQGAAVGEDYGPHCAVTSTRASVERDEALDDYEDEDLPEGTDSLVDARVAFILGLAPVNDADLPGTPTERAIVAWNDAAGRTAAEVIAVLERVAAGEGAS